MADLFPTYEAEMAEDRPLVIEHPVGGTRLIAGMIETPEGIAFADTGWQEAGRHPFHRVEGTIRDLGDGRWQVGRAVIRTVDLGERDLEHWDVWRSWRDEEPELLGKAGTEATLRQALTQGSM